MKDSILGLTSLKELAKSELKKIKGAGYVRYCCEYREDANGNPTDRCQVWSVPFANGSHCP